MQSTKDESVWGHRGGGGFARLHHSLYHKKREQQNVILDSNQLEDMPSGLLFTSSTSDSFHPSEFGDFNNIDYNMQFLRHDTSVSTQGKWQNRIDSNSAKEDVDVTFIVEHDGVSSSPIHSNWMEKLLVVLLVASATVCFLTNLLVLIILAKRRKRKDISSAINSSAQTGGISDSSTRWNHAHTFRYQIVMSHCLAGILASCVVVYPLKILSMVLSKSQMSFHQHLSTKPQIQHTFSPSVYGNIEASRFSFFTSQTICIVICSSPLVAFIFLSLLHSLMLSFEQCLKTISPSHYMVMVSSQGYTRILVGSLWLVASCFTFLPTILDPNMSGIWRYDTPRPPKYYKHRVLQRLQTEEGIDYPGRFNTKYSSSFCYLKEYWSYEYWLLITVGSSIITLTFFALWISALISKGFCKGSRKNQCNRSKTYLCRPNAQVPPSDQFNRKSKKILSLSDDGNGIIERNARKLPNTHKKRSMIIYGRDSQGKSLRGTYKQQEESSMNYGSLKKCRMNKKSTNRLRKCSSWPAMSYGGPNNVTLIPNSTNDDRANLMSDTSGNTRHLKADVFDQEDDTTPIIGEKRRKTSTMIVRSNQPTPIDVSASASCKINFLVVLALLTPCLIYSRPNGRISNSSYFQEILYRAIQGTSPLADNEIVAMAWTHVLVAIAGAFTPVLHLLCDDWISSLGLETLRSFDWSSDCNGLSRIKSSLQLWARSFRKHDQVYTPDTKSKETVSLQKSKVYQHESRSKIKIRSTCGELEDVCSKGEVQPHQKKNLKSCTTRLICNKDIPKHSTIIETNVKNDSSPTDNLTDVIDIKSYGGTKSTMYDDLIELQDDFHYL